MPIPVLKVSFLFGPENGEDQLKSLFFGQLCRWIWACFSILISCGQFVVFPHDKQFVVFPHDKQTCYHKSLRTRHIHKRGAFLGRGVIKRTQRVSSSERPKQHHRGPKTEGKKLDSQKQKNLEPVIERLLKMSNLAIFNPRSLVNYC